MSALTRVWLAVGLMGVVLSVGAALSLLLGEPSAAQLCVAVAMTWTGGLAVGASAMTLVINRTLFGDW